MPKSYNKKLMLALLTLEALETLTARYYDDNYLYGTRLLKYPPEALSAYARAIHQEILSVLDPHAPSCEGYIQPWLEQHKVFENWLAENEVRFVGQLKEIAENPRKLQPHELESQRERDIRSMIIDVINGTDTLFICVAGLLANTISPLRQMIDSRADDILKEVESKREECNKALEIFVNKQIRAARMKVKTSDKESKKTKAQRKPKTDNVSKKAESALASKAYEALCATVALTAMLNSYLRTNNLANETVLLKHLVYYAESQSEQNAQALVNHAKDVHTLSVELSETFIQHILTSIEAAYCGLPQETIFDLEDFATIDNINGIDRKAQRADILSELESQGLCDSWFDNYSFEELAPHLAMCLRSLFASQPLAKPSHGAIAGIQRFAELVYNHVKAGKAYTFDSNVLAQELCKQVQYHTIANGNVTNIMQFRSKTKLTAEQYIDYIDDRFESLSETYLALMHILKYGITKVCTPAAIPRVDSLEQVNNTAFLLQSPDPSGFRFTKSIGVHIDSIKPNIASAKCKEIFLSPSDVQALIPVKEYTISLLTALFIGQSCSPVMLNGDLIAYIHSTGQYYRLEPEVSKNGYATYVFAIINWDKLQSVIGSFQRLLDGEAMPIKPLPVTDNIGARICDQSKMYKDAVEQYNALLSTANVRYSGTEFAGYVSTLVKVRYSKNVYISQHYLSAWIHKNAEYVEKINKVHFDNNGKVIRFEIHHKDTDRRNNHPSNLVIITKAEHDALTGNNIPVIYDGHLYLSLSEYCEITKAGNYDYLQRKMYTLNPGDSVNCKDRAYSIDADGKRLCAVDIDTPQRVEYQETVFLTPTEFARAVRLKPDTVTKVIRRQREAGVTEFKRFGFRFEFTKTGIKVTGKKAVHNRVF